MKKIMLCFMSLILFLSFTGCAEKGERVKIGSFSMLQPESFSMSNYPIGSNEGQLYTSGSINYVPSYQIYVTNTIAYGEYPINTEAAEKFINESIVSMELMGGEMDSFPLNEFKVGKNIVGYSQSWSLLDTDGSIKDIRFVVFNTPENPVKFILIETADGLRDLDSTANFEGMLQSVKLINTN